MAEARRSKDNQILRLLFASVLTAEFSSQTDGRLKVRLIGLVFVMFNGFESSIHLRFSIHSGDK
jgi:hypothetical protein